MMLAQLKRAGRRAIGSLVTHKDEQVSKATIMIVVGYKPDGRCMTVLAEPLPWVPNTIQIIEDTALHAVEAPEANAYRRKDCLQCPLRAGCQSALGPEIEAVRDKTCFMQRMLRPCG